MVTRLFVYGTLRSEFNHPAYQYIHSQFRFLEKAKVKGTLYDLGEYPGAVKSVTNFIVGELYELKESSQQQTAFVELDDYEELYPPEGQQQLFIREITEVFIAEGSTKAWIYWYIQDVSQHLVLPTGNFLDYINHKLEQ